MTRPGPLMKFLGVPCLVSLISVCGIQAVAAQNNSTQKQTPAKPASTSESDAESQAKQSDSAATQTDKPAATTAEKTQSGEIFKPSEEISEDFAVSFPVDI